MKVVPSFEKLPIFLGWWSPSFIFIFFFKVSCNYIGPTKIIQNYLPISRSLKALKSLLPIIVTYLQVLGIKAWTFFFLGEKVVLPAYHREIKRYLMFSLLFFLIAKWAFQKLYWLRDWLEEISKCLEMIYLCCLRGWHAVDVFIWNQFL